VNQILQISNPAFYIFLQKCYYILEAGLGKTAKIFA